MKRNTKGQFVRRKSGDVFEGFGVWYDAKGYPIICINGKDIKLHIYIWERENGEKPKGMQLHHKDFNKRNYSLGNLQLVTQSEHFRIHAGWVRENGVWTKKHCNHCNKVLGLDKFYQRKTANTPSGLCKKCTLATQKI